MILVHNELAIFVLMAPSTTRRPSGPLPSLRSDNLPAEAYLPMLLVEQRNKSEFQSALVFTFLIAADLRLSQMS